jgi:hypothetical protein
MTRPIKDKTTPTQTMNDAISSFMKKAIIVTNIGIVPIIIDAFQARVPLIPKR